MQISKYPYLLILQGKHCNSYFHIDSENALIEAGKKIFKINQDNGYYSFSDKSEAIRESSEKLSQMRADETMLPNIYRGLAKQDIQREARKLSGLRAMQREKTDYDVALNDPTGELRLRFILSRNQSEYEGISQEFYD